MHPRHIGVAALFVLLAAACNSNEGGGGQQPGNATGQVKTKDVGSLGTLLVDGQERTIYYVEAEEQSKSIKCVGECTQFWFPVIGTVEGSPGVNGLGTIQRPDGQMQLTHMGKPLYTFFQDNKAGDTKGNGFTDDFNGTRMVWHAETASGAEAPPGGGTTTGGSTTYGSGGTTY